MVAKPQNKCHVTGGSPNKLIIKVCIYFVYYFNMCMIHEMPPSLTDLSNNPSLWKLNGSLCRLLTVLHPVFACRNLLLLGLGSEPVLAALRAAVHWTHRAVSASAYTICQCCQMFSVLFEFLQTHSVLKRLIPVSPSTDGKYIKKENVLFSIYDISPLALDLRINSPMCDIYDSHQRAMGCWLYMWKNVDDAQPTYFTNREQEEELALTYRLQPVGEGWFIFLAVWVLGALIWQGQEIHITPWPILIPKSSEIMPVNWFWLLTRLYINITNRPRGSQGSIVGESK